MAMHDYEREYRGYKIRIKRDFGDGFHLIDGMPCNFGYTFGDGLLTNSCPGAGWFQTVEQAKLGIDCLIKVGGEEHFQEFYELYGRVREAQRKLAAEMLA